MKTLPRIPLYITHDIYVRYPNQVHEVIQPDNVANPKTPTSLRQPQAVRPWMSTFATQMGLV
jgi:hypothetical protein